MKRSTRIGIGIALALTVIMSLAAIASGDIPRKINYQGLLSDPGAGEPLVGTYTLTFKIYSASSGGDLLWSESRSVTTNQAGVFATLLGSVVPIDISFDGACWLEIDVDGETLAPRRELASVPYAFRAMDADSLGGLSSASFSLVGHTHEEYVTEGEVAAITAAMIAGGQIDDSHISPDAGIDPSKINGTAWTAQNDGAGSGMDADKVDGLNADAFADTGHIHDGRYYREEELNSAGNINQGSNPVDWTRLKSVPGGFADGTDDMGGAGDGHSLDAADGSPTDVVYVADNGMVGIGFTTPTLAQLQVINATGEAIYGSSNDGAGVAGFSQNNNGILGISNNGKAGAFVGEVYVSGRVDSDSGYSIAGKKILWAPEYNDLMIGRNIGVPQSHHQRTVCVGDSTGYLEVGSNNTVVGYNAGHGSVHYSGGAPAVTTPVNMNNVFVGTYAGYRNYVSDNVFVGHQAGRLNTHGGYNTAVGSRAGRGLTTGQDNVLLGAGAGQAVGGGQKHVMCGVQAGSSRIDGFNNTYIGSDAGGSDYAGMGETGDQNTAVGAKAGMNTDGSGNIFLGYYAGYRYNGSNKLFVANGKDSADVLIFGDFASGNVGLGTLNPDRRLHISSNFSNFGMVFIENSNTGDNEASIGFKEGRDADGSEIWVAGVGGWSNPSDFVIGRAAPKLLITPDGNVGIGTTNPGSCKLYVNGGASGTGSWGSCSDLRLKENIEDIGGALGKVLSMRGVAFDWKADEYPEKNFCPGRHFGVIAQEVEEILPEVVTETVDGEKAVLYTELIPVLIESIKAQQRQIQLLEARVAELEK